MSRRHADAHDESDFAVRRSYARWLDVGTKLALVVLVGTFLAYASGAIPPYVPLHHLPQLWSLPAKDYNAAIHAAIGWHWLRNGWRSDYLTYFGILALLLTTVAAMLRAGWVLYARGDRVHAAIALLQVVILALAALGVA
jgi:hypothetical protein